MRLLPLTAEAPPRAQQVATAVAVAEVPAQALVEWGESMASGPPAPLVRPATDPEGASASATATSPAATTGRYAVPRSEALAGYMLDLVNQDRRAAGLAEVQWDAGAASAGQQHATEMAEAGYFSHWSLEGLGPDHRYAFAGGASSVMENLHLHWRTPGFGPRNEADWREVIRKAEESLMQSPGHRANILAPEHTHVGIGMAYNPQQGRFLLAQEFTNHYVVLQPLPERVPLGSSVVVTGQLWNGGTEPLLNLAYEPLPAPLSVAELNSRSTYESVAEIYGPLSLRADRNGAFSRTVRLDHGGKPGLYHIRIWVNTGSAVVLATEVIMRVE